MKELKLDIHQITKKSLDRIYFAFGLICAGLLVVLFVELITPEEKQIKIYFAFPLFVAGFILFLVFLFRTKTESIGAVEFTNEKVSIRKKENLIQISSHEIKSIELKIEGTKMELTRSLLELARSIFPFSTGNGNSILITTKSNITHKTFFFLPDIEFEVDIRYHIKDWASKKGIRFTINPVD